MNDYLPGSPSEEDKREELLDNARAIAAVPELIGVLAGIVERWDSLVPEEEISEEHKQARAALAKATGTGEQ